MAEEQIPAEQENQDVVFVIEKIYVKDLSLEAPNTPQIFLQRETPQVGIELSNSAKQLEDGLYDVAITVTVTSKIEDKTVFLVEVTQAGIFQARNIPEENLEGLLAVTCPNILFPYVREIVSDLVVRAGFPPVLLSPINFEAMYLQQKQQQVAGAESASTH